ncbi:MAG: cadmium-translocating P-type ATPase, partial [Oscillospiraceae bacterium]|nr:cadmium-translocating P-type ATPase [Oscillospiraceae bacterium]
MKQCSCAGCRLINEPGAAKAHNHTKDEACGHDHPQGEKESLGRDILWAGISAALLILSLLARAFFPGVLSPALMILCALAAGLPIFIQGVKNLFCLNLEELSLLTVAVAAAFILGEFFEAAMVTLLFRAGEILEDLAVSRSKREVAAVTRIIPDYATIILPGGEHRTVRAASLEVGSLILVKSGERLPVDCEILSGESSVDSSSLTGESLPRSVGPGEKVLSSSINLGGVLTCRTVSAYEDSAAARIIELVRESAAKKGVTEKLISRFARVYTPAVMVLALLTALLPPLLGFGEFRAFVMRALVFLVASCPCALVIATPLAFFSGIGAAYRQGVLIKGSRYLEALAGSKTVVFDKTGTLTSGSPAVVGVIPAEGSTADEVLALAALCESASTHPLAKAVLEAFGEKADLSGVVSLQEVTAQGMRALLKDGEALCGSARLMAASGVSTAGLPDAPLYVAKNNKLLGAIKIADRPRADAAETVRLLKSLGITRTVILTGDAEEPAREIAGAASIAEVYAGLLPDEKVSVFERIREETRGGCVYVGDGINDSPVLARSDVGVAMGLSSDAAIEAADMVLLSDRLSSLPVAIRIARRTSRLARLIIGGALCVKMAVLILAFLGLAGMGLAVFADTGVAIICV